MPFLAQYLETKLALECLNTNLQLAIDQLSPLKTITPKKIKHPWINDEIQLLIIKRKATECRYVRSRVRSQNPSLLNELITNLDKIQALSGSARSTYHQEQITNVLNNNQDVWRELRHLGLLPSPKMVSH